MVFAEFRELKTQRLVLRRLRAEDAPVFFEELGGSKEVTRYMLFEPHKNLAESEASIHKALNRYADGRFYRWAITADDNRLIGIIDLLRFDEDCSTCSFAYMLSQRVWGRGYGTEALKAVLDFAFRDMEMESVEADHMAENAASGAVMRKVGMAYIGTQKEKYTKDGIRHDAPLYRITRQAWKS